MRKAKKTLVGIVGSLLVLTCAGICFGEEPAEQREIKVIARKYTFEPKTITVRKGDHVRLVVTAEDVAHGIAIKEFDVDQRIDARQSKVVELRFFGGLTEEEISEVLGVSPRTVSSDWSLARSWLLRELTREKLNDA